MKPNPKFLNQHPLFWANVRTISQEVGYTERKDSTIKIPRVEEIRKEFSDLELNVEHIADRNDKLTKFGQHLLDYFKFRAEALKTVKDALMNKEQAEKEFAGLKKKLKPKAPLPLNKQKGAKRNYAFLTGMVNMLIEANIGDTPCNYDPRSLTTITHDRMPYRTMARRVDGAFPAVVNPIAIWEIKEYYYTTTFGSRVADGVYETLLDGLELQELEKEAQRKVQHLLFIDDHFTWWTCGKSYLCRIIDMLHMGYVDEVIFGREVVTRLPQIVKEWKVEYDRMAPPVKKG